MKKLLVFQWLIGILCVSGVSAAVLSETNSGIYVAIAGESFNPTIRFNEKIVWNPYCNNGPIDLSYPDPPYFIKMRMTGPDGKEMEKTSLGKTYGTQFGTVQRFEDVVPKRPNGVHGISMGSITAYGQYDATIAGFSGRLLPAPKELFKMNGPGVYTIELQMQMFKIIKGTNQWTHQIVRFAPMKIQVEKPQD